MSFYEGVVLRPGSPGWKSGFSTHHLLVRDPTLDGDRPENPARILWSPEGECDGPRDPLHLGRLLSPGTSPFYFFPPPLAGSGREVVRSGRELGLVGLDSTGGVRKSSDLSPLETRSVTGALD